MTLNLSSYSANRSDDNMISSFCSGNCHVMEGGFIDKNCNNNTSFGRPTRFNWETGGFHNHSCESRDEILDILPADPFNMDLRATLECGAPLMVERAIFGNGGGYSEPGNLVLENYQFVAGLNLLWNSAMAFGSPPNEGFEESGFYEDHGFFSFWDLEELLGFPISEIHESEAPESSIGQVSLGHETDLIGNVLLSSLVPESVEDAERDKLNVSGCDVVFSKSEGDGAPHEALLFSLRYLGMKDLLSVERVSQSLNAAVRGDPLLWRSIHVDWPLSDRLSDEALIKLSMRAQGNLHCLSLVGCTRITDEGLKQVLESNPRLTELNVPGCTRLSIEAIIASLRALKAPGSPGIKRLRIGSLYGVTHQHFEELKSLLDANKTGQPEHRKPQFYPSSYSSSSLLCDDERAIDIETCPICEKLRLVYDCPMHHGQAKQPANQACRACTICIARCVQCGRCIADGEYEETFCLDLLCLGCWRKVHQHQEREEEAGEEEDSR
ncbi:F-box protein SKIP14 [Amborella trichopoda]|uniref:F-box domain-containing protein n=1 Tax=Amborella trichopoda TaxID=13333 RepID=W1Q0S3_AMBTC|nr:F-box protein SKIP14 [Amborella trichopoda]ERN13640.1 hypothetical protein AMTR_s00049p00099070 [Amborella trichopoda]|eukprot:XP_006852173.1 F-box protein SKIP14 [Amborella trichopoda]